MRSCPTNAIHGVHSTFMLIQYHAVYRGSVNLDTKYARHYGYSKILELGKKTLARCSGLRNTYAWLQENCYGIPNWSGVKVLQGYGIVLLTYESKMDCGVGA